MQRRNSYSDLGLVVAVSVFISILIRCLLFGFTWVSIVWLVFSCLYFYASWRYPSSSAVVKHATTLYLFLSVAAVVGIALFDKNAQPVMHAFEGTGDTIQDNSILIEDFPQPAFELQQVDSIQQDTLPEADVLPDSLPVDELPTVEVQSTDTFILQSS